MSALPAAAEPIVRGRISVIDGDTIRVSGHICRLVGFNAPETRRAWCDSERRLGRQATQRLRAIIARGGLDLTRVRCA